MLLLENELGWRLHKHRTSFVIRRTHPPLSSRVLQFTPILINIFLIVCFWAGRYKALFFILCAVPTLLVLMWLAGFKKILSYFIAVVPALLIFLGLLVRDDFTIHSAVYVLPLLLFISWCYRPMILYIRVRAHLVNDDTLSPVLPFSELKIEIEHLSENGRYYIYIKHIETTWECLVWESNNEDEALDVIEIFREAGIGSV